MKASSQGIPLRILTHNIRYATTSPFQGERPWEERAPGLLNELLYNTHNQDAFICLQEVLHNQLEDVIFSLNAHHSCASTAKPGPPNWAYIGVGRDDGKHAGEYSPIFYRPSVWKLRQWETVWLSETPTIPSKSWDAASIRIVTIGGLTPGFEAAHIILRKIHEYQNGRFGRILSGVFLSGDLNSQEDQEAYTVLTSTDSPLLDSAKLVNSSKHHGNETTWSGFGYEGLEPGRIDYILLGPRAKYVTTEGQDQSWDMEGYAVLANRFDDGVYNSDHRAVVVDAMLRS
ncbi:hypothetical protein AOCH_001791 [Aspergillus ochraceoroseus]|uniref:Endonuclease/exonuclease/phosphatase domain-containing protein n=1 Tax=Aspergillus ochraceoroseus TaxID=138278 RepID=A0A0F8WRR4_9EURO|nr:hypothetical protein AOCH_001791 [Aspergillus ochraceoroseus]